MYQVKDPQLAMEKFRSCTDTQDSGLHSGNVVVE